MQPDVRVRSEGGEEVGIGRADAERLVAELWQVSAVPGAVVAIGKLQHRLRGERGEVVELEDAELSAVALALRDAAELSPPLAALRRAAHAG